MPFVSPASYEGSKHLWAPDSCWGRSRSSWGAAERPADKRLWKRRHRRTTSKHRDSSEAPRRSKINLKIHFVSSKSALVPTRFYPGLKKKSSNVSSSAGPVPLNVYQRLKKLEDRILELEGLSPEYFQSSVSLVADVNSHMLNVKYGLSVYSSMILIWLTQMCGAPLKTKTSIYCRVVYFIRKLILKDLSMAITYSLKHLVMIKFDWGHSCSRFHSPFLELQSEYSLQ